MNEHRIYSFVCIVNKPSYDILLSPGFWFFGFFLHQTVFHKFNGYKSLWGNSIKVFEKRPISRTSKYGEFIQVMIAAEIFLIEIRLHSLEFRSQAVGPSASHFRTYELSQSLGLIPIAHFAVFEA